MSDFLNQSFGNVPRGADVLKTFVGTTTADTSTWTLLATFVNAGTTAAAFATTAVTLSGVTMTIALNTTQSALLANEYTGAIVKTNAGGREPLAGWYGGAFDVPGL